MFEEQERKNSDRPVYKLKGGNSCMWYDKSKNQWIIGDPSNVGTTTGAIYGAAGTARYPWGVKNVWSRWNNSWEKCTDLKVVKGERII
eukprot:TRINITY_DN3608_c0_g1_i1.p1 TRINITY_DN3608_c0_g1~~TRINITY_DN3608_c0_g1_i1.p1  ORF type:complete len:88 (-),score=18.81 TRINITY_DN3608_c0_g1_i1:48-311(-)